MPEEKKLSFPQLPAAVWWQLRETFQRSVPQPVTDTYIATVLAVKIDAARQYLTNLKTLGFFNEENRPTELLYDWLDDGKYKDACIKVLENAYPDELLSVAPPPNPDRDSVERWFRTSARLGSGTARNKAAMYLLIAEADLAKASAPVTRKQKPSQAPKRAARRAAKETDFRTSRDDGRSRERTGTRVDFSPELQLNIQIHISPEASTDQIDAIFASMAKHLRSGSQ